MNDETRHAVARVARSSYSALSQILPIFAKASYADSRTLRGLGCPSRASPSPVLRRQECRRPSVGKPAVSGAATGYRSFNLLSIRSPFGSSVCYYIKSGAECRTLCAIFGRAGKVVSTRSGQDLQGLQMRYGIDSIRVDDSHGMTHFLWNRRRRTAVATGDDKIVCPGRRQSQVNLETQQSQL